MPTSPVPPSDAAEATDGSLLDGLRDGTPEAADLLYKRYADRVRVLARARISGGLAARVEVDDIVQSVFRRFFQAARDGRYTLPSGDELWDLLLVFTLNRVRTAEQFHRAGKRDLRQTVGFEAAAAVAAGGPGEAADGLLGLAVDEALGRLPAHHLSVVRLRMDGYEVAEIAERLGRSKRTVERLLQESRARLKALLELEG